MSDWCILRTKGRHTLPLAQSLQHGGFEVWTPATSRRLPRKRAERPAPLTPTYVFARALHLSDLIDLANAPSKEHPDFSVFHYLDRIPLITDGDLDALRLSERRKAPRERQREFITGEPVCVADGPWVGLSGMVEQPQGRYTMVLFGGMSVRVATFLLHSGERQAA